MKNYLASKLTAIALALPLGFVGFSPATDAQAQTFLQPQTSLQPQTGTFGIEHQPDVLEILRRYRVSICSVYNLWDCDDSVVTHVAGEYRSLFDYSVGFTNGSNGANQSTFATLVAELGVGAGTQERRSLIERYLQTVFSDRHLPPNHSHLHPWAGRGFVSPDDRERIEGIAAAERAAHFAEEERMRREAAERERIRREAEEAKNVYYRKLTAFKRECKAHVQSDEAVDRTYTVYNEERQTERCMVRRTLNDGRKVVHGFDFDPDAANLGLHFLGTGEVAFQITPIEPLGSLAEIEDIENHQQATSDSRARIVELQGEVTDHEDRLVEIEPVVARNAQIIEALGNSIGVLSEAVTELAKDTEKNTAGIALAYALDAPGLSYGKRYAITGALGQFRGESAVGFSGSFKAGENVLISVGGGFAGSGDSSVTGGKVSATYEW